MYGETARHKNYTVLHLTNSDVGLVRLAGTDVTHTVRDMALKIDAHGGLEAWLISFVERGGLEYVSYKRGV